MILLKLLEYLLYCKRDNCSTGATMIDIKQKVGQQIREARKAKGMTQKELGAKIGVAESTVARFENGK